MAIDKAAVLLAIHEIAAHPDVEDLQAPVFGAHCAHVTFGLNLRLGSRWEAEGTSPTGVRPVEEIRLDFGPNFPRVAARVSFRQDFSRNHPHIQPWLGAEGRVAPCLVDGKISEFVAAQGYYRLIDQTVRWLIRAAVGRLIDQSQGWEPTRRDDLSDMLVCDASAVRALATPAGGFKLLDTRYLWKRGGVDDTPAYFGEAEKPITAKLATFESEADKDGWGHGFGVALVVWAGRAPSGGPVVCDSYAPDAVNDFDGLMARTKALRLDDFVRSGLETIRKLGRAGDAGDVIPLPVVLLVRRPLNLIGEDSPIELCSYLVPLDLAGAKKVPNPKVSQLANYERTSASLLARMSGAAPAAPWVLLGCGSLGSKIALHRARSGAAPTVCADTSVLRAHNAARHALYPQPRFMQLSWGGPKAEAMATAIQGLGQLTKIIDGDQRALLTDLRATPGAPAWLINATASTVAREDLAQQPAEGTPRVVEAILFDKASLGVVTREGEARNPNTAELLGEVYEVARARADLGKRLFGGDGDLGTVTIGQGCASLTMQVSDAAISALAAPMSELVAGLAAVGPEGQIDFLERNGLGLRHDVLPAPPCRRAPLEGLEGWTISVSERAFAAIIAEVADYPRVETGGVLMGSVSMLARQIYVTSVLPAPPDSTHSRTEFVLGTQGLRETLVSIAEETQSAIVCVGTWHSHLGAATPSGRDKTSAALVGLVEPRPMAFLIHGADGLRAIIAATPEVLHEDTA
ncbi:Mov34/MPN/PAD-1 family protein [Caulobacter sp. S45]|uniref:Mov34/MPN/PAD-1 family protein n=1 Tax=Caulobacter sp. S45 TaxID=1641861 RepID=UPI00131BF40F|nr:Mov34/MPN/PAD-1 family protein [Caulobacter sp. S45]